MTVVVAVALVSAESGSGVTEVTVAVFERTVPSGVAPSTAATIVKVAEPTGSEAIEQETVPFVPTAGVEQLQPAGALTETKVVPAGSGSESGTVSAAMVPAFATVTVQVRFAPATTGSGVSTFVTERSADLELERADVRLRAGDPGETGSPLVVRERGRVAPPVDRRAPGEEGVRERRPAVVRERAEERVERRGERSPPGSRSRRRSDRFRRRCRRGCSRRSRSLRGSRCPRCPPRVFAATMQLVSTSISLSRELKIPPPPRCRVDRAVAHDGRVRDRADGILVVDRAPREREVFGEGAVADGGDRNAVHERSAEEAGDVPHERAVGDRERPRVRDRSARTPPCRCSRTCSRRRRAFRSCRSPRRPPFA